MHIPQNPEASDTFKVSDAWLASNFPEQKLLSELELLDLLESHYSGKRVVRIYVAPRCYIIPDFYQPALRGMLVSLEEQEEYEACARIMKLLES